MKKLILILTLFVCANGLAQPNGKMQERIKAQKVAFITEKLNLSTEEAQGFWPIYNAFEAKIEALRKGDLRDVKMKMREGNVSDAEANNLLSKIMNAETEMHSSKMKLMNDLKKVISAEKIIRLKAAEDAFNKKLLERLREFRDKRGNRN
ncbi:sensor of ECF-type sigma factor [Psychroserpens sp.]|uniref:sensor of ECF-type sigma factor n=1 Tax=Psychroserpens sp. TaxID=2020870 RepID=UPI001B10D73C|nr:sensor of ECF-type sigma factor [Psychroserpens sp.]MBO6607044.1 sensor of ECF-type sigma factor [Psychroserpens sp.]MBO6632150.1 sensor of ECF-type sigma factor [Psychroserpens sp.]MBO6654190.1 sensor of ECF-type sigma factor [Psychroserpens sp.]MBO6682524.1 sensor of ECF-type sigma factor [Psychroserpens sp.]MBO6750816.1 sensor of ECF-type sigma factor [Psychroserpens sp.]